MPFLRKNEPAVASETIDGEVVAIHLDNGIYYSLQGTAAEIWAFVEARQSVDAIVDAFAAASGTDRAEIGAAIGIFVEELHREDLVVETDSGGATDPPPAVGAFEAPVLSRYTDMQDLLLLDPIHEVDETGWPNRPKQED